MPRSKRTTTGHGVISAVAWDELLAVDAGARFAAEFGQGTRVPRLEELLAAAAGRSGVLIELKAEAERADLLVQRVLAAVEAAGVWVHVRLISFEPDLLERVHRAVPDRSIPTGLIASKRGTTARNGAAAGLRRHPSPPDSALPGPGRRRPRRRPAGEHLDGEHGRAGAARGRSSRTSMRSRLTSRPWCDR